MIPHVPVFGYDPDAYEENFFGFGNRSLETPLVLLDVFRGEQYLFTRLIHGYGRSQRIRLLQPLQSAVRWQERLDWRSYKVCYTAF
jgi:hypothetical protein